MKKKGFTLVEIMIVVAIIGILIAIAVPGFIKARKQSQGMACSENLAKIDGALEQWALENNQTTGDTHTIAGLQADGYFKKEPTCPSGGSYPGTLTVGTDPTCTEYLAADPKLHTLPSAP